MPSRVADLPTLGARPPSSHAFDLAIFVEGLVTVTRIVLPSPAGRSMALADVSGVVSGPPRLEAGSSDIDLALLGGRRTVPGRPVRPAN